MKNLWMLKFWTINELVLTVHNISTLLFFLWMAMIDLWRCDATAALNLFADFQHNVESMKHFYQLLYWLDSAIPHSCPRKNDFIVL